MSIRSPAGRRTLAWALVLAVLAGASSRASAQQTCPRASGAEAEAGWAAYRDQDMVTAREHFEAALRRCPNDTYARTGLGYVTLRAGDDEKARALFEEVVTKAPDDVDALVGLGLVAWREGKLQEVRERFGRVRELAPDNPTARDYLARLPEGLGPAPARPPLVLPDTLVYPARVDGRRFEIRAPGGWRSFYIKGVNLGAALPGRFASQFPDSATYARWIRRMADMNANVVRLYTIHPPEFYEALRDWNTHHPDRVLWLVHGVWTELPADHDFAGTAYQAGFFAEMHRVVDVIHGRADLPPRPGHASGHYLADVSPWTLAFIIGREWEPASVVAFDSLRAGETTYEGRYLRVRGGLPMDAWLGRACDEIVSYETSTYRAQRPVAYTNWPTLDPLRHPTETSVEEEMAIRRARGEHPDLRPKEYDNDAVGLDASLVHATSAFPAGYFASYHAYPYYPDFMLMQKDYLHASSPLGPSNYFGYLKDLDEHLAGMPVVISEYGVPASLGAAHLQPQGWHHGGHAEEGMASIDRRLTREIADAGMAGGMVFSWIDEWFKKNWVTIDFELPADRNRLWLNRMDAEQQYGMWAMEPRPPLPGARLSERLDAWRRIAPVAEGDGLTLRATTDAAYLWLLVEAPGRTPDDTVYVGFDMVRPDAGDFRWPGAVGPRLPEGLEVVLRATGDGVRLLADSASDPFRDVRVGQGGRGLEGATYPIAHPPAGLFRDRVEMRYNLPYYTVPNEDGRYDSMRVVVNRRRFARDSTEYLAVGYDRGVLPEGPGPDGFWERARGGSVLEVRIPWTLLGVTDPSSRSVLQGPGADTSGAVKGPNGRWHLKGGAHAWPDSLVGAPGTVQVDDIGLVAAVHRADGRWQGGDSATAGRFTWPTWEEPEWEERRRPVADTLRRTFASLDPYREAAADTTAKHAPAAEPNAPGVDSADLAWRNGNQDRALTLYEARLEVNPDDATALHRAALVRAWNEDYAEALELLDHLIELEPGDLSVRVDHARVRAWSGDVSGALDELDALLSRNPDDPGALEARALFEAWAGHYEASLSGYDQLLAIAPDNTSARREQARVLSWASRYSASRAIYDSLLTVDPLDVDARLGLARVLTFSNDLDGAVRQYRRILDQHPAQPDALRGLGRALGWNGNLVEAERVLRRGLRERTDDVATLVVLAQTLQWQGRNGAALEVLERARRLAPNDGDVREQLRALRAALDPQVRPRVVVEDDSDGNRMTTRAFVGEWHPQPRLDLRADFYQRGLEQNALSRAAWGLTITGSRVLEPGWTVTAGLGGSHGDGAARRSFSSVRFGLSSPGRYPWAGTLTYQAHALDATALMVERGVRLAQLDLDGHWTPAPGWRVDASVGRAVLRGTERNQRGNVSLSASRRLAHGLTLGVGMRAFGYQKDLHDGYFDPDFYGIGELTGRWLYEPGRWSLLLEGAPGVQQVTRAGDPKGAYRVSARAGYRLAPGREVSLSAGYSSTGLQSFSTGAADYHYTAIILGASWVF